MIDPRRPVLARGQTTLREKLIKIDTKVVRHGADVAARDDEGMTALAQARALGRDEVVDLLRRQGARE